MLSFLRSLFGVGNKYDKPFPWEVRTSLVIYATDTLEDEPDESYHSFVYHDFKSFSSVFMVDGAPYLTVLEAEDMIFEVNQWIENAETSKDKELAISVEKWVNDKINEGWKCFLYETEPPDYAGNAYPWASYADQSG